MASTEVNDTPAGTAAPEAIAAALPALRAEVDQLNLKRVKLGQDTSGRRLSKRMS